MLVSGVDLPQSINVEDMAEDVKVPVVAVSEAGHDQLKMGAQATLLFSNGIGSFSPEGSDLLRPKPSASWRRQRDMLRPGGNVTLASMASLHTEERTIHSESDGSPVPKMRLLPVSHKKQDGMNQTASSLELHSPAHVRDVLTSPNLLQEPGERHANTSNILLEKSILEQAEEQTQAVMQSDMQTKPRSRAAVEALVDFEIKESFEVLDSPQRDATLASMFGIVGLTTTADIPGENDVNEAVASTVTGPSSEHSDHRPMVTADVVCVTPGLSVTNVYRTPVAHRAPGSRHLADVGDENVDPQMEDGSNIPSRALLSHSNRLDGSGFNMGPSDTVANHRQQAFFDLEPASMAGFLARLGVAKGQFTHAIEEHEEVLDVVYSGMLTRLESDTLHERHDAIVRFREFCRYGCTRKRLDMRERHACPVLLPLMEGHLTDISQAPSLKPWWGIFSKTMTCAKFWQGRWSRSPMTRYF